MEALDPTLRLVAALCGGGLALFVFSLLVWTARDIAARSRDVLVRLGAVLLVLILNLFGVVIYLLLRPPETLAERRERELVEELLAREATAAAVRRRVAPAEDTP